MTSDNLETRIYCNFRGVDFRGEEINLVRSPDSLNVWKDYKETESIRTRPELELLETFNNTVWGVFFFDNMMLVHSGSELYRILDGEKKKIFSDLKEAPSNAFVYENVWYFKDGKHYLKYYKKTVITGTNPGVEGSGGLEEAYFIEDVCIESYIPTTSIARNPAGGGKVSQDFNMLNGKRYNTFLSDGKSKEYFLDTYNLDTDFIPRVWVDDKPKFTGMSDDGLKEPINPTEPKLEYTVDYEKGKITFNSVPSAPLTDGQDNVKVLFKKTVPKYRECILNCTMLQIFDNRVFFCGNKDYPNHIWHCSLYDPTYVSDLDHYPEGLTDAQTMGMVAGNNALWVFLEPSDANTTVFYHTPTLDSDYGKIYPSTHSSITTGCIGKAINFNDDIIFFSDRGMEGISGDVTTEQVLGHRSTLIDRKLIAEPKYKDMILEEWEGYLLVFIGNKVYLADSRSVFANENHIEYDWFYWELSKDVTCAKVHNGILYIGTNDGVYTLTDTTSPVESYWVTPKDKFKHPHKLKTTNKRGCVVEATGDLSVYAKIEDTDFELIGENKNITDYFVSRIKRKKFKDIQLKFHSKTRFSLETATLECFIGGYIKR